MTRPGNVQRFCWDQILRTNPLYRISQLFAPPGASGQLLALYALFASIELLNSEVSDEIVARTKLGWWRSELLEKDAGESAHPVVRHLFDTGALSKLPEAAVRRLLEGAESRFEAFAPTDEEAFLSLCREIYRPQVLLESALEGVDVELNSFNAAMLFKGGLMQLLRESGRRKENAFWWIPLSMMARFNVNRNALETLGDSDVLQALFSSIFELGGTSTDNSLFDRQTELAHKSGFVHLRLINVLQSCQWDRLQGMRPAMYSNELRRWRIGDLIAAWKRARQLKMEAG